MKKNIVYLSLLAVVATGFLLRIVYLDKFPPAVSWDEISHGYNAYSILETGRDEWGKFFPLSNFRAYGDYPLALNLYLTIPFIALLGLSELSIRLPHVLLGTLTIVASYFVAYGLTKSKKISLLTSLLVAIEPWHFFFSRFVAQSNLSVFFLTASVAAFLNKERNKYLLPLSVILLGLTLYSYHTTRIFSPLVLLSAIFVFRKDLGGLFGFTLWIKRSTLFFCLIFFLPLAYILANPESRARSGEVFLINEGAINQIIEKRQTSSYPDVVNKLLYNRPVYFFTEAAKNHVGYFSPRFLFFNGGTHYQFSVPGKGLLYLVNLPFFYFGIYLAFKKVFQKNKNYQFILLWFFLAPIAGSITKENFAVMRATTMLPLPQFFSAMGLLSFFAFIEKKVKLRRLNFKILFFSIYFVLLFLNMRNYLTEYFGNYTKSYSQDRQYGYRQVVDYAKKHYEEYDKIVVTKKYGEPHEFFLFFWPWDPQKFKNDPNLVRFKQSDWYWVDRFDKFYFVNDWQIVEQDTGNYQFYLESGGEIDCSDSKCLLITSPGNVPAGWSKLETINFLDTDPAFEIYENSYR